MKSWIRRIRGAIGIGLTWAVGWAPIGAVFGLVLGTLLPGAPIPLGTVAIINATAFGILGFVGGGIFSTVLRLAEGRRRFDQLSLPRFAGLGALGGLLLGGLAVATGMWGVGFGGVGAVLVGVATLLGAGSAAGTLALARQADDRELLEEGHRAAEVGLSDGEARRLLGDSR